MSCFSFFATLRSAFIYSVGKAPRGLLMLPGTFWMCHDSIKSLCRGLLSSVDVEGARVLEVDSMVFDVRMFRNSAALLVKFAQVMFVLQKPFAIFFFFFCRCMWWGNLRAGNSVHDSLFLFYWGAIFWPWLKSPQHWHRLVGYLNSTYLASTRASASLVPFIHGALVRIVLCSFCCLFLLYDSCFGILMNLRHNLIG